MKQWRIGDQTGDGDTVLWVGRQWLVTSDGLVATEGLEGYWISTNRLAENMDDHDPTISDWLTQLSGKRWVDLEDFIAAWCVAVVVHRVELGEIDVMKSIERARDGRRN
jgi:hypothetical protein